MRKRLPWFEILLAVSFLSATLYAACSDAYNLPNRWFIRDDAYYYFKVAQNISEGRGSTFDGLHMTNGYHPLWLLICIPIFALARFDLILPLRALAVVTGIFQVTTAILMYHLIRRAVSAPAGVLAALYWAFNSYILLFLYKTGVESIIALFFIVLLLLELCRFEAAGRDSGSARGRMAAFGALALLIVLSRLDLIFFALILGIWIVFRGTPLRYLLPLDVLALVVSAIAAFLIRLGFTAYYDAANSALLLLGIGLAIKIPALYLLGLYEAPASWSPLRALGRLLLAITISAVLLACVLLAGSALGTLPPVSRIVLLLDWALSLGLIFLIRVAAFAFRLRSAGPRPPAPLVEIRSRWRGWLTEALIYYGIVGGGLAIYMLWNQLAFGTPTPVSGQIKHWWGTFIHSIYGSAAGSWVTFFAVNPFSDFNAWAPPTSTLSDWATRFLFSGSLGIGSSPRWQANFILMLCAAALAVCVVLAIGKRKSVRALVMTASIPLFAGSWLQILGYNATGYASPKEWYWLTEPVLLVILGAILLNVLFQGAAKVWTLAPALIWVFVAWYGIRATWANWSAAYDLSPYGVHPPGTPYTDVIPFLESTTEPGAVIGMTGGGNIGYLMPSRTIVNMDGLINSTQYFRALQAGTGADYLYSTGMRYVFANPNLLEANPYHGQYTTRLQLIVDWGGKDLLRLLPPSNP
jgi:hypothetical protein